MAIHAPIMGAPLRAIPLPPVLAFLMGVPVAPRDAIERVIQAAIDALDTMDGDPDLEADGDELDGTGGEDDFCDHNSNWLAYPGCPISDPGGEPAVHTIMPGYGDNQDTEPLNYAAAERAETLAELARAYAYEGRFEEAKKITARLTAISHPAMTH
jgi:hypothetical protein